jgi:hypothetical protein
MFATAETVMRGRVLADITQTRIVTSTKKESGGWREEFDRKKL